MSDQPIIPESMPANIQTNPPPNELPMDEFEAKNNNSNNNYSTKKNAHTKVIVALSSIVLVIIGTIAIVLIALRNTNPQTSTASPTPFPTIVQTTSAPTPQKDIPVEWESLQNELHAYKDQLSKPNEDRGKLSLPAINFETTLKE